MVIAKKTGTVLYAWECHNTVPSTICTVPERLFERFAAGTASFMDWLDKLERVRLWDRGNADPKIGYVTVRGNSPLCL